MLQLHPHRHRRDSVLLVNYRWMIFKKWKGMEVHMLMMVEGHVATAMAIDKAIMGIHHHRWLVLVMGTVVEVPMVVVVGVGHLHQVLPKEKVVKKDQNQKLVL